MVAAVERAFFANQLLALIAAARLAKSNPAKQINPIESFCLVLGNPRNSTEETLAFPSKNLL